MKMRYITIALLGFLAGAAITAAVFVAIFLGLLREGKLVQSSAIRGNPDEMVVVLTARQVLSQWSIIRGNPDEYFDSVAMLRRDAPANFIEKGRDLKGRRLKVRIAARQVLTEDHLIEQDIGGPDVPILERGKLAMAIRIEMDRAVGVLILPGSRVDVVHLADREANVIVSDVLVLAIDSPLAEGEDKRGFATLGLDKEQVLLLSAAREKGKFSLVFRAGG
jgi:Flp pilus assembly protein CpaB